MANDLSGPCEEGLLVQALRRVIEKQTAFSMVISDGVSERIFYFAIGGVRVIRSGPRKVATLADILGDLGEVGPEEIGRILTAAKQESRDFGETAVRLGMVSQAQIDEAQRLKLQDELLDLFLWDGAEFRLFEGQPPKAFYDGRFQSASVTCEVSGLLQTVLARIDEWRAVLGRLPTGREVYEAGEDARNEYADGPKARLLSFLDGTRTSADAITRSGMRRVGAYEFLLELLRDNKARRVASAAAQKITRDELVREIEALEDALKVSVDATIVRQRLARTLEAAGETARAAAQWKFLGDRSRRQNELDKALDAYRSCVRVAPTDFATRELILEIHRHKRNYPQLVADGRPLADLFLKHNLLNRAKHLLAQLVGIEPNDTALRRQLVLVLIGLGERDAALKQLRELARQLEARNAPAAELRDAYVRILALDKRDAHARKRLDKITGAALQRRVLHATIGVTVAVLVGLGGWFVYEAAARRSVNQAIETARKQIDARDFKGARTTLQESAQGFSRSRAARLAASMLEQLDEVERQQRAMDEANGGFGRDSRPEQSEPAAAALADRADGFAKSGRIDEAHRVYREILELYPDTAIARTLRMPLELDVVPAEARVLLNGEDAGQGPMLVHYPVREKCTLAVELEGFTPYRRVIEGPIEPRLAVSLAKPLRWTYSADAAIDAAPLVAGGIAYVAGRDRCLTALSVRDGSVQWRAPLGFYSDVAVQPVMQRRGIFVATATGEAVFLDPATGEVLWRRELGATVERQPLGEGLSALVVAPDDGSIAALAPETGEPRWSLPAGTTGKAAPIAVADDEIAYVDPKGGLAFVTCADGSMPPRETQPAVLRGAPAAGEERIWVLAEDSTLRVIARSGRAVKRFLVPAASDIAPAVWGDVAYTVGTDGGITAFRASGETLFRVKLDEVPSAPPAVAHMRLYVPGSKRHMTVLDAATGALLWRFDTGSRVTATPVVADGTVYVVTAAGKLFALEE